MKNSWSVIIAFVTLQGCGSGDTVKESLVLRVDGKSSINLSNSKPHKSVWDSQKELEILVRESCALPGRITEARSTQRTMGGERFEVRVEANTLGAPRTGSNRSLDEMMRVSPQIGSPIVKFSQQSSSMESFNKRESRDEHLSEITLQSFDINSLAKEGVIVDGVPNLNAHMDLVRLLRRDFNMMEQVNINYNLIKAIDKTKSFEENKLALVIADGKLICVETRNLATELKR